MQLCLPSYNLEIKITIKNLLHFLEYFDDKIDSIKNFHLGFEEVRSIHLSFGFFFFAQIQNDLNEKRSHRKFSAILNLVTWPASLVCSRSPRS